MTWQTQDQYRRGKRITPDPCVICQVASLGLVPGHEFPPFTDAPLLRLRALCSMTGRCLVMPRGINVGGRNRVPMAELRAKLADLGFTDVSTVLQSGNVIVSTDLKRPDQIADSVRLLLRDEFDVDVPCVVRTAGQVRRVLECNPLRDVVTNPSRHLVNFLSEEPDPAIAGALLSEDHSPEVTAIEGSEIHVWAPDGIKAATLSHAYLERRFGCVVTARNWNTVERIAAKL